MRGVLKKIDNFGLILKKQDTDIAVISDLSKMLKLSELQHQEAAIKLKKEFENFNQKLDFNVQLLDSKIEGIK